MGYNGGVITGNAGIGSVKNSKITVRLQEIIGDPSNGPIAFYDGNGSELGAVIAMVDAGGDFAVGFQWDGAQIGRVSVTSCEFRLSLNMEKTVGNEITFSTLRHLRGGYG